MKKILSNQPSCISLISNLEIHVAECLGKYSWCSSCLLIFTILNIYLYLWQMNPLYYVEEIMVILYRTRRSQRRLRCTILSNTILQSKGNRADKKEEILPKMSQELKLYLPPASLFKGWNIQKNKGKGLPIFFFLKALLRGGIFSTSPSLVNEFNIQSYNNLKIIIVSQKTKKLDATSLQLRKEKW